MGAKTQVAKGILQSFAGDAMTGYFKGLFGAAGKAGRAATQGALNYGAGVLAPGVAQSQLPKLFRSSAQSALPQLGYYGGQAALAGGIAAAVASMDQQSDYTQPMPKGVGNKDMANFLYSQQLQNQKFMHDMALIQARAESRIPGAQYAGSLLDQAMAEKQITDAGEITNREVQGIGRMIYGTGLRA